MATGQFALQSGIDGREFGPPLAIDLDQVSVSQLLGRDYIFIDTQGAPLPIDNPNFYIHCWMI